MSQISEACGGGDAGRALVPGSLRGYRTWRMLGRRAHVPDGALPLTSVTRRRVVWTPSLSARCEPNDAGSPGPWSATLDSEHRAPQAGCSCGIYGWYDPTDSGIVSARVFGVVEASGLILMGERGYRAETVKITAIVTRNRRLAAACERAGIAVYGRRRDLLRDYPPEDLSSLLGRGTDGPEGPESPDSAPGVSSPHGFDGLVFLALWGRVVLIASALVTLPAAPVLVTAVVAHFVLLGLMIARLRY
jgi:hypothetical protein